MDENTEQPGEGLGSQLYIIIGVIVLVAVGGAWYFLRGNNSGTQQTETSVASPVVPTPTPGPITALACEQQYYNPVVGFPQYYLSAEGVDLPGATKVDCQVTASVNGTVVSTAALTSPLTSLPQRGGSTFRCTTNKVALTPNVQTVVDVKLKDDRQASATCSATYILPSP